MPSITEQLLLRGQPQADPRDTDPEYQEIRQRADEDPDRRYAQPPKQLSVTEMLAKRGSVRKAAPTIDAPPKKLAPKEAAAEAVKYPSMAELATKTGTLQQEGLFIRDTLDPEHPQKKEIEEDWKNRYVSHLRDAREEELYQALHGEGMVGPRGQAGGQVLRRIDEAMFKFGSTLMSGAAHLTGNKKAQNYLAAANIMKNEYNSILDRDAWLAKKAGPDVSEFLGNLGASLTNTTVSAVSTGGLVGVAGMIGMDDFNTGMFESQKLEPWQQFKHAAVKAGIGTGVTLAGGAVASKMGVANGETLIPFVGRAANGLFTKAGLTKAAMAAAVEGGEEGLDSVLKDVNSVMSGQNPDGAIGMMDRALVAASTGILAGTVTQAVENSGVMSLRASHVKNLVDGWVKRLPKAGDTPKAATEADQGHVQSPDGKVTISRADLNKEVDALQELEAELEEQYAAGGGKELQHLINERDADIKGTNEEINDLKRKRAQWIGSGISKDSSRIKNLDNRIDIAQKYAKEIASRKKDDQGQLKEWSNEFKELYKDEKAYIKSEFDRLTGLRELPDVATKVGKELDKQAAAEAKTADKVQADDKAPKTGEATGQTRTPEAEANATPDAEAASPQDKIFTSLNARASSAKQADVKFMRKVLGLNKAQLRESLSTDENFRIALERNLDERAPILAREVMAVDNRILNSVELAGLQHRYVGDLQKVTNEVKSIKAGEDTMSDAAFEAREAKLQTLIDDLDVMTEAWIKSSSEAGAALQAQQRLYGVMYSPERMMIQARRAKGSKLTKAETKHIIKNTEQVELKAMELEEVAEKYKAGSDEYDLADMDLETAKGEVKATVALMKPRSEWLAWLDTFNSLIMQHTLSGDMVPIGRQGGFAATAHPKISKDAGKVFMSTWDLRKNSRMSDLAAFRAERAIRELPDFKTLTQDYKVPLLTDHTPYNEAEGSGFSRMQETLRRGGAETGEGLSKRARTKIAGKHKAGMEKIRFANFDKAYRAWLNSLRFNLASQAYNQHKYLLKLPDGKRQMQTVLDMVMNTTGHAQTDFGETGRIVMTAPKWFISRMALPLKAIKHVPLGLIDQMRGKQSASRVIKQEYVKSGLGGIALAGSIAAAAAAMFGTDNVSLDVNPGSKTFGYLTVGGRVYDLTFGQGFVMRAMAKGFRGGKELASGKKDKIPDTDMGKMAGSLLTSRGSPATRLVGYAVQSGKPISENERMGMAEYAMRQAVPLSWQETKAAMTDEGIPAAAFATIMEQSGFSAHEKKQ